MTSVSSVQGLGGYAVRARFRGPVIGHALNIGWRRWRADCATCQGTFRAETRVVAGALLGAHYRAEHEPVKRVALLR